MKGVSDPMPLAAEHFRALMENRPSKPYEDAASAADALKKMIADTQQLTLSQLDDSIARQLGSILFSHEAGLISALSTMNPPEVKVKRAKGFPVSLVLSLCAILIIAGAAASAWKSGDLLTAFLAAAGAILTAFAAFLPRPKPEVKVSQTVDEDALFRLAERRMEAIDRDLEAFLSLPAPGGSDDESVLQLITLAVTLKREDPDTVPDELMTAITALTISRGYTFLEYDGTNDAYFDIMPTKRATRTIAPAVLKGDRLVARGMAIVQLEETPEDTNE